MSHKPLALLALLFLQLFVAACSLPSAPEPTIQPSPIVIPSLTLAPSPTFAASPTFLPTPTSSSTPTVVPTATISPYITPQETNEATFYLVALEDQGESGIPVGCDDSLVAVTQPVEPTSDPVRAALERLFSFKTQYVGESGLYTALWQADLMVDEVRILADGTALVSLSGTYLLGGVCDTPRFQGQIEQTILAAPGVTGVQVTLNGQQLEEALSSK